VNLEMDLYVVNLETELFVVPKSMPKLKSLAINEPPTVAGYHAV